MYVPAAIAKSPKRLATGVNESPAIAPQVRLLRPSPFYYCQPFRLVLSSFSSSTRSSLLSLSLFFFFFSRLRDIRAPAGNRSRRSAWVDRRTQRGMDDASRCRQSANTRRLWSKMKNDESSFLASLQPCIACTAIQREGGYRPIGSRYSSSLFSLEVSLRSTCSLRSVTVASGSQKMYNFVTSY